MVTLVITGPLLTRDGTLFNDKNAFRTRAGRLIHDNRRGEVIPLAEKHIKQEPLDPYGLDI